MSRYRKVDVRIWNDEKFRSLSNNGKLVFFMLLTHPNMTAIGAMRSGVAGLAEELGWNLKAFREAFQEALSKGMAEHDPKACLTALPNFLRYNPPESPNVVKAWAAALDLLPECSLKTRVIIRTKGFVEGLSKGFREALPEAFAKGMPKGMPNQEQEQEQEQITPPTPSRGSRSRKGGKGNPFPEFTPEVCDLLNGILAETPKEDESGRRIAVDAQKLGVRLVGILGKFPQVDGPTLLEAWRIYLGKGKKFIKAPQFYFGDAKDNGDGANWQEDVAFILHRRKREQERAKTLVEVGA